MLSTSAADLYTAKANLGQGVVVSWYWQVKICISITLHHLRLVQPGWHTETLVCFVLGQIGFEIDDANWLLLLAAWTLYSDIT